MKFNELITESKDDKLLDNLRLWYKKYSKLISGYSKQLKSYYIKVDNPYEDFFNSLGSHYDLCELAEFVVKYCFLHNGKMVRPYNAPHTPTDVLRIANGLEINLGSDIVYYTGVNDLDSLRVDFEFLKCIHKYIVKNCMEPEFKYVYERGDRFGRFSPAEYFRADEDLERQMGVQFDYKKQKPIANDNWLRVRNEMGFLVDINGKNFI